MQTFDLVRLCCEEKKDLAYFKENFKKDRVDETKLVSVGSEKLSITALSLAVVHKRLDLVTELIKAKADPNIGQVTSLYIAVDNIRVYGLSKSPLDPGLPIIKLLLDNGANPNQAIDSSTKSSALHLAAQENSIAVIIWLLSKGANINHLSNTGIPPIFVPAQRGHANVVKILCQAGDGTLDSNNQRKPVINLDRLTIIINGQAINASPLSAASQKKHAEVVKILLPYIKPPYVKAENIENVLLTAVLDACVFDNNDIVLSLLVNHIIENHRPFLGRTINYLLKNKRAHIVAGLAKSKKIKFNEKFHMLNNSGKVEVTLIFILINSDCPPDIVQDLLNAESTEDHLNIKTNGIILLHDVVLMRKTRILRVLLKCKTINIDAENDIDAENNFEPNTNSKKLSLTALQAATHNGFEDEATLLLEHNASIFCLNKHGRDALFYAAMRKRWKILKMFMAKGANLNKCYSHEVGSIRLIHLVIITLAASPNFSGDIEEILEELYRFGVNILAMPTDANSPLAWAVSCGSIACTRKLISLGAAPNESHNRYRPIHMAMFLPNSSDMIQLLADQKVPLDFCPGDIASPLELAVLTNNTAAVKKMLELGVNPNGNRNTDRISPLKAAVIEGDAECTQLFINSEKFDAGNSWWEKNNNTADSALLYVVTTSNIKLAEILLQKFDPLAISSFGLSPLLLAIFKQDEPMYTLFINHAYKKDPGRLAEHMRAIFKIFQDELSESEIEKINKHYSDCVKTNTNGSTATITVPSIAVPSPATAAAAGFFPTPEKNLTGRSYLVEECGWTNEQVTAAKKELQAKRQNKKNLFSINSASTEATNIPDSVTWFNGALESEYLKTIEGDNREKCYLWLPKETLAKQDCDVSSFVRSRYHFSDQCIKPICDESFVAAFTIAGETSMLKATHELKIPNSPARILLFPILSGDGSATVYMGGKYLKHGLHNTKDTKSLMQSLACLVPIKVMLPEKLAVEASSASSSVISAKAGL